MKNLVLILLPLALLSCTKPEEVVQAPPPTPAATPPPVVIIEPTPEAKVTLAELKTFLQRVSFRREKEMNWQDAILNLPLFRFDAVRTHDKSTAQIDFANGSKVDMTEDSLLIINPGAEITAWDRLLLRKGNLKAETQKELWILTTAALVRMKPSKTKTLAKSRIQIEEGKNLSVELEEGEGLMLQTEQPGKLDTAKPVKLIAHKPVVIAAPTVATDFGLQENEVTWPTAEKVDEQERTIASVPPPATKPNIPPPDFVITSPADYSEVAGNSVTLKGRVKGQGVTSLLVNGKAIALGPKQEFNAPVTLANKGANTILIQLNRNEGTPVFRKWTVIRK